MYQFKHIYNQEKRMKTKFNYKHIIVVMAILFVTPALLMADTMIRQVEHMDAVDMPGRSIPAQTDTSVAWMKANRARVDKSDTVTFIVHMDDDIAYILNRKEKNYAEISLKQDDDSSAYPGATKNDPMRQMMTISATVTPTDETKKIGDWNCKKYNVDMKLGGLDMKQEIWATEDVKIDYDMFHQASNAMLSQFPGYEDLMTEMKKLKGIPIQTTINVDMMGNKMTRTINVIEIKDAEPPGGYDVPEGYTKTEAQAPMGP
jgi:hypothetical protein